MECKIINKKPNLIVVVGPTASGKTALAIRIAKRFNSQIVSADSRQIYREMDIGTAKPPRDKSQIPNKFRSAKPRNRKSVFISHGVPHYLIDIRNPNESYTVADYKRDAIKAIRAILKKGKLPILIGGTGLYVDAVTENLNIPKAKPNPTLRKELEARSKKYGLKKLFEELVALDPEAAYIVDPNNPRRVIRALEVALTTGKPFSAQRKKGAPLFNALKIGVAAPKEKLRGRINRRADEMVREGLVDEVKRLVKKYGANCHAFDAIGYREIINCLNGEIPLAEAVAKIKTNTWRYAKRQLTWFRKDREIKWIRTEKQAFRLIKGFL